MGDIDFATLEKLKIDGNAVAAFKLIYNYITKTASTKYNPDHSTLAQVVDHLLLILPKIAQIPKYQNSMKSIAGRLQMDLWALYNNNSHAVLKSKDREADWVAGRRAWLILDKFTLSKRFVRALFHTCEFARFDSMITLFREFRQEVVQYSSIPGFGVCLTNELLILMNDKYQPEEADTSENLLQQQIVTPTRETFKEIRAFVNALKAIVFEFPSISAKNRSWRTHHLICMGRIAQILKKYLTSGHILMTENLDENDIQEVIYGFAQITHNLCQSLTPVPKEQASEQKTKDLWFALDGVLLPLNQSIGSMALALSSLKQQAEVSEEHDIKHKYPCFAVYSFLRLIQTVEKQREELTKLSRAILVETALKNVKGCFSYLMSAARNDDEFSTYQHWSLVELTINELSWIFEQHGLCSYERTNIMDIYNALAIKVSGHRSCTKMETLMVKMFLNQLLCQSFKRSPSPLHANLFTLFSIEKKAQVQFITILISLLTESGPPQLPESIALLVATLNEFSEYRKLPEGEQDLLKLVIFQLREVFPEETKKLTFQCSKNEEVPNEELTCVWKILSSWQKDLQTAWSANMAKKSSPPIRLDIEKLCNIKVREQFSKCSTTTAVLNYVNTIYIAAKLLLIVGKREAGTSLLKKLLKLIVDWYYPKKNAELEAVSSLIADLAMDLGSSMWVMYKHSIYSSQAEFDDEVGEILNKARDCLVKSEHEKRLVFGNLMNEDILPSDQKSFHFEEQEELDMVTSLRETPLSSASPWSEYHDKALGHVGSMLTDHHKCGLRYAIQLLVTVLSLNCDRSFYSTLFSTSAKSQGALKIQKIGREILSTLRSLEKTIWISAEHVEDLLIRGMSTEARQFANELLVLSEIWGLQSTYILAKSFQIRALELEGQTRKWREEVPALLKIFKLDSQNEFMRGINPQAKAAAISLDPPRRNSSNIEEMSEDGLKSNAIKKEFAFDCSASPITKIMAEKHEPKTSKFNFKLPVLPKMADLDIDIARNYAIALTSLLRVQPDPQSAVNAGLCLFKEIAIAGHGLSQWLSELVFVVILRALELTSPSQTVDFICAKMAEMNSCEKINPKNCRRFARFQVAQIIYDRTFKTINNKIELEEPFTKMKVKSEMKTPARRRLKQDLIVATPTITPMRVPSEAKLSTRRKQRVPVFKDSETQEPSLAVVNTPVAPSVHATRMTRAMARRAMKTAEPVEDNRAPTASDDEPEEAVQSGPAGDFLDLSPIKNEENDNAESVRLQRFHSRPVSPITAEVNSVFNTHTPIEPSAPSASDEAILDEALITAREFGDMETIRAILNLRIGEIIRKQQVAEKSTIILSDSAKLGELHGDVVGIGALIDTEFGCQLRLSNNITVVPERNQKKALDMISSVNATDDFFREHLEDVLVIVSLIPEVSKTLHCSYENCLALVTRMEPNGAVLSVAFDGTALASEALKMRHTVDQISEELSKEVTDPNQWWETRAKRNDYCQQLWTSKLPDVLGPALPLFTFPKAITWPKEAPQPKMKSSRALYLNYAVRAWSFMNTLAKTNVAGIVNIRKVDLDKLVKAHTFVEMQYQRTTSTYLVLGRLVQTLCFERMPICKGLRMSRMMSMRHAEYLLRTEPENRCVDICDVLYVVDSQTNLAGSAETVGKFFQSVKEWDGYTSMAPPSNELIKKLNEKSLYIFAGHGSGSDCVGGWGRVVRKGVSSTMHLIGCGSGRLRDDGRTEPRGAITKILDSGCESVLAMLWSVTDRDIDRFTLRLYADWFSGVRNSSKEPGPCISRYINEAARACKLGAANAGACVNYGLIPACYNIPENWDRGLPAKINYK